MRVHRAHPPIAAHAQPGTCNSIQPQRNPHRIPQNAYRCEWRPRAVCRHTRPLRSIASSRGVRVVWGVGSDRALPHLPARTFQMSRRKRRARCHSRWETHSTRQIDHSTHEKRKACRLLLQFARRHPFTLPFTDTLMRHTRDTFKVSWIARNRNRKLLVHYWTARISKNMSPQWIPV